MSIRYVRGFGEVRKDPGLFGKLGIATVLILSGLCVPFVGHAALQGWAALALRQELEGRGSPLPALSLDFDYLRPLIGIGFKALIVSFVWTIPMAILTATVGTCLYTAVVLTVGMIGSSLEDGGGTGSAVGTVLFILLVVVGLVVVVLLALIAAAPATMAVVRTEVSGEIGDGFKVGEVLHATRLVLKELVIGGLANALMGVLLVFVGFLLLCFGMYPALAAVSAARAFFHADLYRLAVQRGMQPLRPAPAALPSNVPQPGWR